MSTLLVNNHTGSYSPLAVEATGTSIVSHAGAVLLLRTAGKIGLTSRLSEALASWRKPMAVHDPGKTVLDLAIAVALGGDCLADIAVLREQPAVFGPVASDPTVSRTIDALAKNPQRALRAIDQAAAAARSAAWSLAGTAAPDHGTDARSPLVIDLDATLVTAHSEKERRRRPIRRASASTRCSPSSTTGSRAAANRSPGSCGRATPAPTPPTTTSP